VPAIQPNPVDSSICTIPVFLPRVPHYLALPPNHFNHGIIMLGDLDYLPSSTFYLKLNMQDKTIIEKILSGLSDKNANIRSMILTALPSLNLRNLSQFILPLLKDPVSSIKLQTIKLLENEEGKIITEKLGEVVEKDPDPMIKLAAAKILTGRGITKYDIFIQIERLKDSNDAAVIDALNKIVESNNPLSGTTLKTVLFHKNPDIRQKALDGLLKLEDYKILKELLSDDRIALSLKDQIGRFMTQKSSSDLQKQGLSFLIQSGPWDGAIWAIKYIEENRMKNLTDELIQALSREEANVRHEAMKALASFKDLKLIDPLVVAVKKTEDKKAAEDAVLTIIGSQSLDVVLKLVDHKELTMRQFAMRALGDFINSGQTISPQMIATLRGRLSDPDQGIKKAAIYTLARINDEKVASILLPLENDKDPEIREQVAIAARNCTGAKADGILLKYLNDEEDKVKLNAVIGVREHKLKEGLESLKQMARYGKDVIRREVWKAIVELMPQQDHAAHVQFFIDAFFDPDSEIRFMVIDGVRDIKEQRVMLALSGLVTDKSSKVKIKAIEALAEQKNDDAVEHIFRAFFDEDKAVRMKVLEALDTLGSVKAIDPLKEAFTMEKDPDIKKKASEVLEKLLNK
jgi:HEAT repeat protein